MSIMDNRRSSGLRRPLRSRPAAQGHGLRARACAPAADAVQLRRPAVRRCAVGRQRQARPLRLHAEDARSRHRCRGDAQPARRDGGDTRGQEMDPRQPGRCRTRSAWAWSTRSAAISRACAPRARRDADRRPVDRRVPRDPRRRDDQAGPRGRGRHRIPAAAAAQHALHARHDLLDLRRRHPQPAVLAGAARGDRSWRRRSTSSIPTSPARSTSGGATRPRTTASPRSKAAT